MFVASSVGGLIYLQKGMPYRYPEASAQIKKISDDLEWVKAGENEKNISKLNKGQLPDRVGRVKSIPCFILWGDSHARALIPAISSQANQNGLSGYIATQSSHPPILGMDGIKSNMEIFCHHEFNDGVISFIKDHPEIKTVILVAIWECYANGIHFMQKEGPTIQLKDITGLTSTHSNRALLKIGLNRTINTILGLGRQVVIVSDPPDIGFNAQKSYWLNSIGIPSNNFLPTMSKYQERNKYVYAMLHELAHRRNVTIIYPESMLVNKTGQTIIMADNKLLYRDDHHLSKYGAEYVSPVFNEVFHEMVNNHYFK